jgi:hypothetical protein
MDMAGMLVKSLGIDPEEMKAKGEQIYNWVASKIESIDSQLADIKAQNALILLAVSQRPVDPLLAAQLRSVGIDPEKTNTTAQLQAE